MFELNQAIAEWRAGCAGQQTMTDTDLEELEGHLREEIDHLVLTGLSEEEGFLIATRRLGDTSTLSKEFAKVNTSEIWKRRTFWMLSGILISLLASSIAKVLSGGGSLLLSVMKLNPYVAGVIGSILYIIFFLLLLFLLFLGIRKVATRFYRKNKQASLLFNSAASIILLGILSIFSPMLMARLNSPEILGQQMMAAHITAGVWAVLWPFVLVALLLILWPSRTRTL